MPATNISVWLEIASIVLKYGWPAVQNIVSTWSETMTDDEIRAKIEDYQARLRRPEDYFE